MAIERPFPGQNNPLAEDLLPCKGFDTFEERSMGPAEFDQETIDAVEAAGGSFEERGWWGNKDTFDITPGCKVGIIHMKAKRNRPDLDRTIYFLEDGNVLVAIPGDADDRSAPYAQTAQAYWGKKADDWRGLGRAAAGCGATLEAKSHFDASQSMIERLVIVGVRSSL